MSMFCGYKLLCCLKFSLVLHGPKILLNTVGQAGPKLDLLCLFWPAEAHSNEISVTHFCPELFVTSKASYN